MSNVGHVVPFFSQVSIENICSHEYAGRLTVKLKKHCTCASHTTETGKQDDYACASFLVVIQPKTTVQ